MNIINVMYVYIYIYCLRVGVGIGVFRAVDSVCSSWDCGDRVS